MPHALKITDTRITGYDASHPQPFEDGWTEVTPEQFALAQSTPRACLVDGQIVSEPPLPPAPLRVSKLKLRRALRAANMEALLDGFLASDPSYLADWNDAQFLATNDPFLTTAIPMFAQAANLTEAQVMGILQTCRG